jgi:3-isopropylmalate dehydrogenase
MARLQINVLPGDGIGPEVMEESLKVLRAIEQSYDHTFAISEDVVGGASIDKYGSALRPETLDLAQKSDAVLFGAVGGPKWDDPKAKVRPEQAILGLRKGLGLFANLRPVKVWPQLIQASTIRPEVLKGVDMVIIRELTGGLYFGKPQKRWESRDGRQAVDTLRYSEREVDRIIRVGFELARTRRNKLTIVDKANVLETGRLWREIGTELAKEYKDVETEFLLVDAAAMHLIRRPGDFDVMVTENMFGDILTDEASMLSGSMGMQPSASLGRRRKDGTGLGMYEPIHGTAPDIAGQGKANPLAMILSAAMMLRYSLGLTNEADAIERAVDSVLEEGYRTADIVEKGGQITDTVKMGNLVVDRLDGK